MTKDCPICEKKVQDFHPRSHIIPEFLFKPRANFFERQLRISSDFQLMRRTTKAHTLSGICWYCEEQCSIYESYASQFLVGIKNNNPVLRKLKITFDKKNNLLAIKNIDCELLSRFVLSVVIKQHCAESFLDDLHWNELHSVYNSRKGDGRITMRIFPYKMNSHTIYPNYSKTNQRVVFFLAARMKFEIIFDADELELQSSGVLQKDGTIFCKTYEDSI